MNHLPIPQFNENHNHILLDIFNPSYEAIYILLHPFQKDVLNQTQAVSWQRILQLLDIPSIPVLNKALQYYYHIYSNPSEQWQVYIDKLRTLSDIKMPKDGDIPLLLQTPLFDATEKLGYNELIVCPEYLDPNEIKKYHLNELREKNIIQEYYHAYIYTQDMNILIFPQWDSHYSFLCSSKENIDKILKIYPFEGFFCDKTTQTYWSHNFMFNDI